jgi:hypothetical protein
MYPRRGFYDRLHDSIPIDGDDVFDLVYLLVRWVITAVLNTWQS